ncbi:MAG TPA: adenylate/guanylate cyclase domain-containing protein [bacterium]|jgi:class 3 adenylate cyclase
MPTLSARKRARLPDRAFAYIDSRGRRLLPIHDKAHVRNALARFNQVAFEDDTARERARKRLLVAAKKYRIVPIGFITGQLQSEKKRAGTADRPALPTGFVTLLMTDIEASTPLLHRLGDRYGDVLNEVRGIVRTALAQAGGREIDVRADEFFAVFERPLDAVQTAAVIQRRLGERTWPDGSDVRIRMGIHSGRPKLTETGYIGIAIHTTARVCAAAHGGQIVVSGRTRAAVGLSVPDGIRFRSLGRHRLPGLPDAETLFQIEADGLATGFPPPRTRVPRKRTATATTRQRPSPTGGQLLPEFFNPQ